MMARNSSKLAAPDTKKFPRKSVQLHLLKTDSEEVKAGKLAMLTTSPELAAYRVINAGEAKTVFGEQMDVPALMKQLRDQAAAANRGDLSQAEAMLMNQATALQSLFTRLTEQGLAQLHMPNLEGFMRLALRAQSQCRATLETLAAIKNPPIVYARQANVTTGPQQINNGVPSQAGEKEIVQSKQSGGSHELLPDARPSQAEGRIDPPVEALGNIDRAEVAGG